MMDASYQIYHKEGMGGFKKGMLAAIIQNTPMSGLTFCFKGIFRDLWLWFFSDHNIKPKASISTCGSVVTSLLAGICAKTVVYPFDLMKKRLQIQGFDTEKSWSKEMMKCSKLSDCFFKTIKTEGYSGLFKGLAPSVIKAGTFTAVYFTLYEQFCFLIAYIRR